MKKKKQGQKENKETKQNKPQAILISVLLKRVVGSEYWYIKLPKSHVSCLNWLLERKKKNRFHLAVLCSYTFKARVINLYRKFHLHFFISLLLSILFTSP